MRVAGSCRNQMTPSHTPLFEKALTTNPPPLPSPTNSPPSLRKVISMLPEH
jgi:hypothetical protein